METIPFPDMDRLATFVAVMEHGGFRQAAKARYLSPSTVQKQMRALEDEIGIPLFERKGRNVAMTQSAIQLAEAAGDAFYACGELQNRIGRLRAELHSATDLRLTTAPVHMARFLAVALHQFEKKSPVKVDVTMQSLLAEELASLLDRGEADVIISAADMAGMADMATANLWRIDLVAVLPPGEIAEYGGGIPIESLIGKTVFAQESLMWSRRKLEDLAERAEVELSVVTEQLPEVCIALAEAGLGVAVVADDNFALESHKSLPLLDSKGNRISTHVSAYWRSDNHSSSLKQFIDYLEKRLDPAPFAD